MTEETQKINQIPENPNTEVQPAVVPQGYAAGELQQGTVTGITSFGAFVKLPDGSEGLVHISEIANTYVTNIENFLKLDQVVTVKVLGKNPKGKYDLSIKQALPKEQRYSGGHQSHGDGDRKKDRNYEAGSFDDLIHQFMKNSEERQLDVRRNLQYRQGVKKKGKKKKELEK